MKGDNTTGQYNKKEGVAIIFHYFKHLSQKQQGQFNLLGALYPAWNSKINLISRKDIDQLYLHHVLHSLSIAQLLTFQPGTTILDVGTGGGFPGIPLAIMFPTVQFHLVDSIHKKIHALNDIVTSLALLNVTTSVARVEAITSCYDFILGRAVADLSLFYNWVKDKVAAKSQNVIQNGILYLKGEGAISLPVQKKVYPISSWFEEPFFQCKELVHLVQL